MKYLPTYSKPKYVYKHTSLNLMQNLFGSDISEVEEELKEGIGKTMVIDRLSNDLSMMKILFPYVSYVKIGWGLAFLTDTNSLLRRITQIKSYGIGVSNGGTFLETCFVKGKLGRGLKLLKDSGFNYIEISEGVCNIPKKRETDGCRICKVQRSYPYNGGGKEKKGRAAYPK